MQRVIEGPQPRPLRRRVTHRSFQLPILEVKQTDRQPEILVCLIAVRDFRTAKTHSRLARPWAGTSSRQKVSGGLSSPPAAFPPLPAHT